MQAKLNVHHDVYKNSFIVGVVMLLRGVVIKL